MSRAGTDGSPRASGTLSNGKEAIKKVAMRMLRHPVQFSRTRNFGRGRPYLVSAAADVPQGGIAQDLRMFALTFAGGFLFMTVYLA